MKRDNGSFGDFLYDYYCEFAGVKFRLVSDELFLKGIDFCNGKDFKPSGEAPASAPVNLMINYLQTYFSGGDAESFSILFRYRFRDIMVKKSVSPVAGIVLDMEGYTEKEISVYRELVKVKSGDTVSYGELALRCGIPGGARFIGNTMARNRFPVIIPCHRVVKSDGSMGNFSGGVDIKEKLLRLEIKNK